MKELREIPTENLVAARRISAVKATETDGNMGKKKQKTSNKKKQQQQQKKQQAAGPYLYVSARRGNKKTGFRYGIPRFRNLKTRRRLRKCVIPETDICQKHVKKCSSSVVNVATET